MLPWSMDIPEVAWIIVAIELSLRRRKKRTACLGRPFIVRKIIQPK
jgi:hypothetical protein